MATKGLNSSISQLNLGTYQTGLYRTLAPAVTVTNGTLDSKSTMLFRAKGDCFLTDITFGNKAAATNAVALFVRPMLTDASGNPTVLEASSATTQVVLSAVNATASVVSSLSSLITGWRPIFIPSGSEVHLQCGAATMTVSVSIQAAV
jgi:hypothetical protein